MIRAVLIAAALAFLGAGTPQEAARPEPVALLGSIALSPEFRAHGDEGVPAVVAAPNDPASRELTRIAGVLASMPRGLRGASLPLSLG